MNSHPTTAKEIFLNAAEIPAAERQAYIDSACAGNEVLRGEVEDLLRHHEQMGSFLQSGASAAAVTTNEPTSEGAGTMIGPYKLLEPIGEGGMGTVWMAQQTDPVKRVVAVKLIKAGMDSKQVIARFEAERQALALMDHTNIARVLDAGTTDAGRPFFVMDLVKGVPITKYCDEHHLTPRQRLELFVPVCQAVQHAHQKGIIHRDLKPSNVLVALYDGKPVPKVIDFGVAKAVGQPLTDKTLVTGFGNIVGTLEYMSPEQAEFNQLDIDTRSDIYSLGVLLYELLAGSPPFTRKDLEKAGMLEMLRVIREKEPSKPSNKLSTADGLPTLAANRGTEPANLTKLVRGELDWIVMKALEKDRNRRYETANGFAMDVQRYLADEAVLACPPSAGYRLQKFVRRNKVALVTAAFIGLTLLLGALISTWQAIRATHAEGLVAKHLEDERKARRDADIQRKAAEAARNQALVNLQKAHDAVKQFLTQAGSVDLAHVPQMEAVRRELLEKALLFYQGLLKEEQGPDADIRFKTADAYLLVGKIHMTLGQHGLGAESLGKAHGMLTKLVDESPGVAVYRFRLAWNHYHLGGCRDAEVRTADSEKEYGRAVELMKELVRQHPSVDYYPRHQVEFQMAQAGSAQRLGRDDQARQLREEAMAMAEKTKIDAGGRMWDIMGRALSAMGNELWAKGERIEAEKVYRRALKFQEQAVSVLPQAPGRHHGLASMRMKMGLLLKDVEQLDEAERLFRASVAAYSELTANFPSTTKYRAGLGESSVYLLVNLTSQKRFKEAEEVYRGSLPRAEKLVADAPGQGFHWTVLVNHHREYGLMLVKAGRLKDAEMAYQQGLVVAEKMRAKFPVDRSALERMISLHRRLASVFRETGRRAEAEAASRKADELEASLKLK